MCKKLVRIFFGIWQISEENFCVSVFLFLQKVFSPKPREQENCLMIVYDPACF